MAKNAGVFCHEPGVIEGYARVHYVLALVVLLLNGSQLAAEEPGKTVVGPRNVYLADGADALFAGDGEEGVRLTLKALAVAHGPRETKHAHANLCAGYAMIDKPLTALEHCNWVIENDPNFWRAYNNRAIVYLKLGRYEESEADIARGQALRPGSDKLKTVKGMLLDKTDPVTEAIEIDERRSAMDDGSDAEPRE
jgi:tetratricopeptide (TPR) repeat protein